MIVQAKLAAAAVALAGSAVLAEPVRPDVRTEILVGPYEIILDGRAPQFTLSDRCIEGQCALIEIVLSPRSGPKVRIAL